MSSSDHLAIEVSQLSHAYGTHKALNLEAFSLERGESCSVIGPSGCGKSTLVHLLAGLLTPPANAVHVLGRDLAALTESERDRFRGRHIGFVFQRFHLMPALTVHDNLVLAQRLARCGNDLPHVTEMLAILGLTQLADRKPRALSHGQAQRVAIARALVHRPELVIADEPTSALDDAHADEALNLLTDTCASSGAALLLVTHDQRVRGRLAHELSLEAPR